MRQLKTDLRRIVISGGLSGSDFVCQKLSNLCQLPVWRSNETEATAAGIAWLALAQKHRWKRETSGQLFKPQFDDALQNRFLHFQHSLQEMLD